MEEEEKIISATSVDQLWQEVISDFEADPDPLDYHVVLEQQERRTILDIYNNHAVGFEALAFTTFSAYLFGRNNFRFAIYNQGFKDELSKFFGMQDVILGFKDFDEKFIIKTNDETKAALIFANTQIRDTFLKTPELSFGIVEYTLEEGDGKAPFLELKIEKAITDPIQLREIYNAFFNVLLSIEK